VDTSARSRVGRPSAGTLIAFASLGVPLAAVFLPLGVYLPPFYAQTLGLGLGTVGLVFMLSRLWNALCDPLIGILSDHTRSRFGRRKPWIAAGALDESRQVELRTALDEQKRAILRAREFVLCTEMGRHSGPVFPQTVN